MRLGSIALLCRDSGLPFGKAVHLNIRGFALPHNNDQFPRCNLNTARACSALQVLTVNLQNQTASREAKCCTRKQVMHSHTKPGIRNTSISEGPANACVSRTAQVNVRKRCGEFARYPLRKTRPTLANSVRGTSAKRTVVRSENTIGDARFVQSVCIAPSTTASDITSAITESRQEN